MNQNILNTITWYRKTLPLDSKSLELLKSLDIKLPRSFLQLLQVSNGGAINATDFSYYDSYWDRIIDQAIGFIFGVSNEKYNIVTTYINPPEFFPRNIVAFADTGNGDLICFDYRSDPKSDNPPIVYWNHEAPEGRDVSFIAKDFEEFLAILKEPEDL